MSRIGLIDVDKESRGKCTFPNLALMKLSSWHKAHGDVVEWYTPDSGRYDRVYMSKVFGSEYTKDYPYPVNADEIIRGGSGYAISVVDGKEVYDKSLDPDLPYEVEHSMPDYSLYGITDTAYGFLTRGCPRGCSFCHTAEMQGRKCRTHANLSEFHSGQKNIVLLDPNITAHPDFIALMKQLSDSKAYVDFSQGLDIRLLTEEKIEALNQVKVKRIHIAWDNPNEDITPKLEMASKTFKRWRKQVVSCYVLTNYNSTHEQDLYRINTLRRFNVQPDVRIYRKPTAPLEAKKLQRWCNPFIFWKCESFEDYQKEGN